MDAMSMAIGPAMSMTWTRMPGQSWAGAASSFVATWTVMMVAMMLPSLVPVLHRYRLAAGSIGARRPGVLTALVALGYFAVWSALGAAIFPLGATLAVAQIRLPSLARAVPMAAGVVVLLAGFVQFTAVKARHLAFGGVAAGEGHALPANLGTSWNYGVCLGIHCNYCCAGLTASLLSLGVMDLRVMAVVTAAITAERLAPAGARVARAIGVVGIATGALLIARAVGSG
jgi:predicted metal-binding membrane protein